MNEAKMNLERWMFYFDRFKNHEVSAQLDQAIADHVEDKMQMMQKGSSLTWIEVSNYINHLNVLTSFFVESRRISCKKP